MVFVRERSPSNYKEGVARKMTYVAAGVVLYHTYGFLFTVVVYHELLESIVGLFFALIIYMVSIKQDIFSDSLAYIFL